MNRKTGVAPDGSILEPMWYVTGDAPAPIRDEVLEAVDFLIETAEWLFINLVMSAVDSRFPYVVAATPDDQIAAGSSYQSELSRLEHASFSRPRQ